MNTEQLSTTDLDSIKSLYREVCAEMKMDYSPSFQRKSHETLDEIQAVAFRRFGHIFE